MHDEDDLAADLPMVEDLHLDDPSPARAGGAAAPASNSAAGDGGSDGAAAGAQADAATSSGAAAPDGAAAAAGGAAAAPAAAGAAPAAGTGAGGGANAARDSLNLNRNSLQAAAAAPEAAGEPHRRVVLVANGRAIDKSLNVLQAVHLSNASCAFENSGTVMATQHALEFALASEVPGADEPDSSARGGSAATTDAVAPPMCSREQHLLRTVAVAAKAHGNSAAAESSKGCLVLLRILEAVSAERRHFASVRAPTAPPPATAALPAAANEAFFSMWTNARLLQQLSDVVAVCGNGLPQWTLTMPQHFKCLLPFESRRRCARGLLFVRMFCCFPPLCRSAERS